MPHLVLQWQPAAVVAACLAVLAAAYIRTRRARLEAAGRFAGEAALLFGLFALWQYAGSFAILPPSGGLPRARWLWHVERLLHLPDEGTVQRAFLSHPLLIETFNLYYGAQTLMGATRPPCGDQGTGHAPGRQRLDRGLGQGPHPASVQRCGTRRGRWTRPDDRRCALGALGLPLVR